MMAMRVGNDFIEKYIPRDRYVVQVRYFVPGTLLCRETSALPEYYKNSLEMTSFLLYLES
jgi:hypothetical protein